MSDDGPSTATANITANSAETARTVLYLIGNPQGLNTACISDTDMITGEATITVFSAPEEVSLKE
jgi:hypothetical protein